MIKLTQGDILYADAEALVNTVNCVGVMGRGIALQFKKVFPENFKRYKAVCVSFLNSITPYMKIILPPLEKGDRGGFFRLIIS
jgi:O-acetyl-ADP-ribose deacetylase (regulator of RNase III)